MTKANPTTQTTPTFNQSQEPPIKIDWLDEQTPVVSSVDVARHFGKKHHHVLRDINELHSNLPESFSQSNFGWAEYTDEQGKSRPAYNLTRDGFSLLVMGFTGKAALKWKLRYIEAFNALEKAVLQNAETQGVKSVLALSDFQLKIAPQVVRYRKMGLNYTEIARLLDCNPNTVAKTAKKVGA